MMKRVWYWLGLGILWCGLLSAQDQVPAPFERAGMVDQQAASGDETTADDEPDPFDPESDPDTQKQVQIQVEFIELTQEQYSALMFDREMKTNATPLRKELQEWIKQGKAKVLETMMCVANSGQAGRTKSADEYIYPTEYEPAGTTETKEGTKTIRDASTPTAFEMRELGGNLIVEPTISATPKIIDLRLTQSLAWLTGETVWLPQKNGQATADQFKQPRIFSLSIETQFGCCDGQYTLIAVLSPKDQTGQVDTSRKILTFVKADILSVTP